jgi:hypothetical protein
MTPINLNPEQPGRSLGKGLGQQTGGDEWGDAAEAITIFKMICNKSGLRKQAADVLTPEAFRFLEDQIDRYNTTVTHYRITGKQLFWLRDIKDKLVEAGIL